MIGPEVEHTAIQAASLARLLMHRREGIAIISASLLPPDGWLHDESVRQAWKEENDRRNDVLYSMAQAAGYRIWRIRATWTLGAGHTRSTFIEKSFAVVGATRGDVAEWCQALQVEEAVYLNGNGLEPLLLDGTRESLEGPVTYSTLKAVWKRVRERTFPLAELLEFPVVVPMGWCICMSFGAMVDHAWKLADRGLPVDVIAQRMLNVAGAVWKPSPSSAVSTAPTSRAAREASGTLPSGTSRSSPRRSVSRSRNS